MIRGARRLFIAATLGIATFAAADEATTFADEAAGFRFEVAPGYVVSYPNGGAPGAAVVRLDWPAGPWQGIEAAVAHRDGPCESPSFLLDVWERRAAGAAPVSERRPLGDAELLAAGADDGVSAAYILTAGGVSRRLELVVYAAGPRRYSLEVSYPSSDATVEAGVLISTFRILSADAKETPPAGAAAAKE